eukprot:scaffold31399_cov54-Phaeocystis_antarctica.AAC.1
MTAVLARPTKRPSAELRPPKICRRGAKLKGHARNRFDSCKCGEYRRGRATQKRATGGRWRRIVLGHVLADVVVVEEVVHVSGPRSSGSFGSDNRRGVSR